MDWTIGGDLAQNQTPKNALLNQITHRTKVNHMDFICHLSNRSFLYSLTRRFQVALVFFCFALFKIDSVESHSHLLIGQTYLAQIKSIFFKTEFE